MFYLIFKKLISFRILLFGSAIFLVVFVAIFSILQADNIRSYSLKGLADPFATKYMVEISDNDSLDGNYLTTARIENTQLSIDNNWRVFAVPKEFIPNDIDWKIKDGVIPIIIPKSGEGYFEIKIGSKKLNTKIIGRTLGQQVFVPFEVANMYSSIKQKVYISETREGYDKLKKQDIKIRKKYFDNNKFAPEVEPELNLSDRTYKENIEPLWQSTIFVRNIVLGVCSLFLIFLGFKIWQFEQKNIYLMKILAISKFKSCSFLVSSYISLVLISIILAIITNLILLQFIQIPELFDFYRRDISNKFFIRL